MCNRCRENISNIVDEFCIGQHIIYETTTPHTRETNCKIKRKNKIFIDMVKVVIQNFIVLCRGNIEYILSNSESCSFGTQRK